MPTISRSRSEAAICQRAAIASITERWILAITLSLWALPAATQSNASQVPSPVASEGPSIAWSWPADGARSVAPGAQVELRFLAPISSAVDTGRIRLSGEAPSAVSLSDDARSLYLSFADLSRKTSYRLIVSAGAIASRGGVANREAITLSFSTAAAEAAAPVRVSVGFAAGSIVKGAYAFVLDRGGSALS